MSTPFEVSLAVGKLNEQVIQRDLHYRGIELIPTYGKHPFDFYLPDGRSLECKLDLYSQARNRGAIEWPTIQRGADFYAHSLCYTLYFPHDIYQQLYMRGKVPERKGGMGDYNYEGRLVDTKDMRAVGMYGNQFVKYLMQQQ